MHSLMMYVETYETDFADTSGVDTSNGMLIFTVYTTPKKFNADIHTLVRMHSRAQGSVLEEIFFSLANFLVIFNILQE